MPKIETERLVLQPMTADDMPDIFSIYSNQQALKFVPSPIHESLEQTTAHFQHRMSLHWTIRMKGQKRVIGAINFIMSRITGMGYIIHPDYWGHGITVEACQAMLDRAFTKMGEDRIELWIDETNKGSLRVAQKLGFEVKGRILHKFPKNDNHHFTLVWGMTKAMWRNESPNVDAMPIVMQSVEPVLMVHDVQATANFYRDKLGFDIDFLYDDPPNHAGVSRGEWTGNLVSIQLSQVPTDREIIPAGYLHIRVSVGIDRLYQQYKTNEVTIEAAPDDKPWGFREFSIKDLNGHTLVFAQFI